MSRRTEIAHKKPPEILVDLLQGYQDMQLQGPVQARKYLERSLEKHHSLPNAVKFFLYDLLAKAAADTDEISLRNDSVQQALKYMPFAQEEMPRMWKENLPQMHCFLLAIEGAMDEGLFAEALEFAERAIALGLGKVYEQKAESIRWMM